MSDTTVSETRMTNSESVEYDRIVARNIFAMLDSANSGVNRMKFITLATVLQPHTATPPYVTCIGLAWPS